MFGAKMRWPEGEPGELERAVLAAARRRPLAARQAQSLGDGTRRPLRLVVRELWHRHDPSDGSLVVGFVLPKGGYATTVLSTVCVLEDATRSETDAATRHQDDFPPQGV